jgi:hypothetical protein
MATQSQAMATLPPVMATQSVYPGPMLRADRKVTRPLPQWRELVSRLVSDKLRNFDSEILLDHHDFTEGDQLVIDIEAD